MDRSNTPLPPRYRHASIKTVLDSRMHALHAELYSHNWRKVLLYICVRLLSDELCMAIASLCTVGVLTQRIRHAAPKWTHTRYPHACKIEQRLRRDPAMGHPSPPATQRSPALPTTSSPAVLTLRDIVREVVAHDGPVKHAVATEISTRKHKDCA